MVPGLGARPPANWVALQVFTSTQKFTRLPLKCHVAANSIFENVEAGLPAQLYALPAPRREPGNCGGEPGTVCNQSPGCLAGLRFKRGARGATRPTHAVASDAILQVICDSGEQCMVF